MASEHARGSLNALPPGTVLRDYVIESELGSGGFSIVYLARHHLKSEVAVRHQGISPGRAGGARAREGTGRECAQYRRPEAPSTTACGVSGTRPNNCASSGTSATSSPALNYFEAERYGVLGHGLRRWVCRCPSFLNIGKRRIIRSRRPIILAVVEPLLEGIDGCPPRRGSAPGHQAGEHICSSAERHHWSASASGAD